MASSHSSSATGRPTLNGDRLMFIGQVSRSVNGENSRGLCQGSWLLAYLVSTPEERQQLLRGPG